MKDICKNCNVSTRTFYNHFQDKYDLLNYVCVRMEEEMLQNELSAAYSIGDVLFQFGTYIHDKQRFFINAFKYYGQNSFFDSCYNILYKNLHKIVSRHVESRMDDKVLFAIDFFSASVVTYTIRALQLHDIPSPEVSNKRMAFCIPEVLRPYY